ncbi:MAG: fluoride efflux transporter CrcB [Rhodobacteraceae bacterium]|nr:fluoride efflux transporter CrcB [Paracoccaceae bacterium]
MLMNMLIVALGGAVGAVLRYLTGLGALRVFGPGFPWGTFTVNLVGSFLMGLCFVLLAEKSGQARLLLMTGALGGFTTFSAFSLDAVTLWQRGAHLSAASYTFGTVILGFVGLIAGIAFAKGLTA